MDFYQQREAMKKLAETKFVKGSTAHDDVRQQAAAAIGFAAIDTASALDRIASALESLEAQHGAS